MKHFIIRPNFTNFVTLATHVITLNFALLQVFTFFVVVFLDELKVFFLKKTRKLSENQFEKSLQLKKFSGEPGKLTNITVRILLVYLGISDCPLIHLSEYEVFVSVKNSPIQNSLS